MNIETLANLKVNLVTPELLSFVSGAQKICRDHIAANFPNNARLFETQLQATAGPRYIRITRAEYKVGANEALRAAVHRSGHCFIDRANGDVLMCASWKTPAKGARGNIFDDKNGLGRMGPYGTAYNR